MWIQFLEKWSHVNKAIERWIFPPPTQEKRSPMLHTYIIMCNVEYMLCNCLLHVCLSALYPEEA